MKTNNKSGVFAALRMAARAHYPLTVGTLLCVASSVIASLLPPLLLARIIDGLAAGLPLTIWAVPAWRWRGCCPRRRKVCWCCLGKR